MKPRLALLTLLASPAMAHRLDEYLQASLLSLSPDRVQIQLDLTPGVAVLPLVMSAIDTDRDGTISEAERGAYASQVLRDLSLSADGETLQLRLVSRRFPELDELKQGLGVIRLEIAADLPPSRPNRRLNFENHHQSRIAAYLVNSLVPQDPSLRITAQSRNFLQSAYQVNYSQTGAPLTFFSGLPGWLYALLFLLLARAVIFWRASRKNAIRASHVNMKVSPLP
jgi:hypothetical protein